MKPPAVAEVFHVPRAASGGWGAGQPASQVVQVVAWECNTFRGISETSTPANLVQLERCIPISFAAPQAKCRYFDLQNILDRPWSCNGEEEKWNGKSGQTAETDRDPAQKLTERSDAIAARRTISELSEGGRERTERETSNRAYTWYKDISLGGRVLSIDYGKGIIAGHLEEEAVRTIALSVQRRLTENLKGEEK